MGPGTFSSGKKENKTKKSEGTTTMPFCSWCGYYV